MTSLAQVTRDASEQDTAFTVNGMDCASCVAHVQKAAVKLPGVQSCNVSLARGRAVVRFNPLQVNPFQIATAISQAGYPTQPQTSVPDEATRLHRQQQHTSQWLRRAIAGIALWFPVELLHWVHHLAFTSTANHMSPTWIDWLAVITSSIALVYVGSAFYRSAWLALRRFTSNMDTLISLGASVAWGYSAVALAGNLLGKWHHLPDLYFMEATGLLALISLGHWLEARARTAAGSAIHQLLNLAPATAWRVGENDEAPAEIPVADLEVGDRIIVRPGDRVPSDGVVIDGQSSIDESMISGEPLPVTRAKGEAVIGGTVNQDGRLIVRVTKVGSATALAQIVKLVESAQDSKPPVQKLADQIAAIFVPAVLGIALFTGIGWLLWAHVHSWDQATTWATIARAVCSVLIIACPCALGLAVPAAIMVGSGIGARNGILIRNIDAIQQAEKIDVVLLDKTGTITRGKPVVMAIEPVNGTAPNELLRLAAAAEQYSEHPLARAIVAYARAEGVPIIDPLNFTNEPGYGVAATIDGRSFIVGSDAMLTKYNATASGERSGTTVFIAERVNGAFAILGSIIVADEIKLDSTLAIASLHKMGLRTALISGDNAAAARAVAKQVGIDDIQANVKPAEKAQAVMAYQSSFGRVAMVGDGINDAPALAAADLGIAIGSGSDVAKETGGIVLVTDSLMGVADAIRLSRATMRTIRQNLFLAFIYNVLAIPLAAFGLLNPLVAAAAMALSDVTVIGNALLLRKKIRIGSEK